MKTAKYSIESATSASDLEVIAALFAEYAASLPIDLGYQDFTAELAALPGKYAPPHGALLLARDTDGTVVGCVGLRPIAAWGCCEMKRLYVLPARRGLGLGRALVEAVIHAARRQGYRELRLDTLASMQAAQTLYAELGFVRTRAYYAPTPPGTVFMTLELEKAAN